MNDDTRETIIAASLTLLVEAVAVTLFIATAFVWIVIFNT